MMPWYERAFGEFYLELYAHRDEGEARRVLDLVFPGEELVGCRVLDLACGAGRYLPEIQRKGGQALGMDLSLPLLHEARAKLEAPVLVRADMRRIPLVDQSVDWLLSLFTSFGYFEDLETHRNLSREWARVVRTGMVLDVPNPEHLEAHLVANSRREHGDRVVEEARRIEDSPRRVVKELRVLSSEGDLLLGYEERVMLFSPAQLDELMDDAGMEIRQRFGDYDGSDFTPASSPRQILKCYRKDHIR